MTWFKKVRVKDWLDGCTGVGWTMWFIHLFGFRNWCVGIVFRTHDPVRVKEKE